MEQLAPIIKFLKKNRFWLSCGLIAVASFVTWYLAAGALQKKRDGFIKDISSMQQTAQGIKRTSASGVEDGVLAHPNASTEAGMKKQIDGAASSLIRVWEARREAQAEILKWPADVIPEEASDFISVYEQFDPPEAFPGLANQNMGQWLGVYKQNIPKRMVVLCERIGARWSYDEDGELIVSEDVKDQLLKRSGRFDDGMGMDGEGVDVPEELPVVVWSEENQLLWNRKLTDFKDRDGQSGVDDIPTPIQVIMLQQDLWLLEAMFAVIKELNGGADANDIASIKEIAHLAFGREAVSQLGELTEPDPRLANVTLSGEDEDFSMDSSSSVPIVDESEEPFDPYPGEGKEKFAPYHGRYVDKNYKPLSATQVQEVLMGDSLPEENLELLVAKRVPVRIALTMDERKIGDFIAACANSPFAFEIWQVRLNRPLDSIELGGSFKNLPRPSAGDDGMDDDGMFDPDDMSDDFSSSPFSNPFNRGNGEGEGEGAYVEPHRRNNYDVSVEFYGIVKIYNPVNKDVIMNPDSTSP